MADSLEKFISWFGETEKKAKKCDDIMEELRTVKALLRNLIYANTKEEIDGAWMQAIRYLSEA